MCRRSPGSLETGNSTGAPVTAPHEDQRSGWSKQGGTTSTSCPLSSLTGRAFFYVLSGAKPLFGGDMIEQEKQLISSLPKTYEPQAVEGRWYRFWEAGGYFKPSGDTTRPTFVISMPPPNVTGALHLGHAITATVEDILIRYHRMKGDDTLWVPGEDHAGIGTQTVVERLLAQEGTDRHAIGRAAFLERVWQWVYQYKSRIQDQHRRLSASCELSRERFTLDEGLSKAVREVFVRLYDEGLIYRGERIINWCPRCMSALSDLEVNHVDTQGTLTYVRYPLKPLEGHET